MSTTNDVLDFLGLDVGDQVEATVSKTPVDKDLVRLISTLFRRF